MEASTYDLLLVGGGVAGLRVDNAADLDSRLGVAVVSKFYPMGRHTVSVESSAQVVPQVRVK